jgi:transposase
LDLRPALGLIFSDTRKQGHDVRLIPAQFVKPFVKSNKNDFIDAESIAEAVERKNIRSVPITTDDRLDLQGIHRVLDRLICRRTAVINHLLAFLLERGMAFAHRPANPKSAMADILENAEADLTPQMRSLINMLWDEWKLVEEQIKKLDLELERTSAADADHPQTRDLNRPITRLQSLVPCLFERDTFVWIVLPFVHSRRQPSTSQNGRQFASSAC